MAEQLTRNEELAAKFITDIVVPAGLIALVAILIQAGRQNGEEEEQ